MTVCRPRDSRKPVTGSAGTTAAARGDSLSEWFGAATIDYRGATVALMAAIISCVSWPASRRY